MRVYNNILETIGNTPLVRLQKIEEKYQLKSRLYAKLESFNPSNSVKTRPAYWMFKDLQSKGLLNPETTIIESTSGNTGIGLAMVSAYFGNPCILVMPDSLSKERIDVMKLYGATILLTPGVEGIKGSNQKARDLSVEIQNSVIPSQFSNPANPLAHYATTAPEIAKALYNQIDYFMVGVGTGGTITGCNKYFKEQEIPAKIIAIEPKDSAVLSGNNPGKHKIQGIGAGFIPEILDPSIIDEIIMVDNEDAYAMTKFLPTYEGISIGISSGAVLHSAIQYCLKHHLEDKNIVMVFPDSAEKYISTGVFD